MVLGSTKKVIGLGAMVLYACVQLACVDERVLTIVHNKVPVFANGGCTIPGDPAAASRSLGIYDVNGADGVGYELYPLILNDLPSSASIDGQPERNRIRLKRFKIRLSLESSVTAEQSAAAKEFTRTVGSLIEPGAFQAVVVPAIPQDWARSLTIDNNARPVVTVRISVVADHAGGEIESEAFTYQVGLCRNCLVVQLPNCPTGADEEDIKLQPNACGLAQDGLVSCCTQDKNLICLASGESN